MKKKKKYTLGTRNIQSPNQSLYQNELDMINADMVANSNSLVNGLEVLAALSNKFANPMFSLGGQVPVEVEGEEMAETPKGEVLEFKGKKHEEGGIDINLPEGTKVFSERISIDGVSMADRKKKRTVTLKKLLEQNLSDKINKATYEKTEKNNKKEEELDMQVQELVSSLLNNDKNKYAVGGKIGDFAKKVYDKYQDSLLNDMTSGDVIGLLGNIKSTFGPKSITEKNRASDTPNINYYENYGKDALQILNKNKEYINSQRSNALMNLENSRAMLSNKNRNTARGVNTLRALDLAGQAQVNQGERNIDDSFSKQMMQLLGQQMQLENQQDSIIMQGEEKRDIANRQDKANYYSQLAQDTANIGRGLQEIGKDINQLYKNSENKEILDKIKQSGLDQNQYKNLINEYFSNNPTSSLLKRNKGGGGGI